MEDHNTKGQSAPGTSNSQQPLSASGGQADQTGRRISAVMRDGVFYLVVLIVLFVFGLIITETLQQAQWWVRQ